MSMSYPLGDMLTRIRNGQQAKKAKVRCPASTLKASVLDVLKSEGYIRGYAVEDIGNGRKEFLIEPKYDQGRPAIETIDCVSTPGRRVYYGAQQLPRVRNGLGILIVSTPKGVLSDQQAREANVGGEVLCQVF
jgi:small subunit ribosomal protein S8